MTQEIIFIAYPAHPSNFQIILILHCLFSSFRLCFPPPSSLSFYHLYAQIGPAALLWAFCPCSGRRLAHRGSCYNFHFLNVFLFFPPFFPRVEPRKVFYPALQHEDEGARGARWQLRFRLLSLQRRQTNKVQTAYGCRALEEGSYGAVRAPRGCGSCV